MRRMFRLSSLILLFTFGALPALEPVGHVNDFAGIYSKGYVHALEEKLKNVNGVEIAVVTLKDLQGAAIEEKARDIFDAWKIGNSVEDDGLLLLISMKERALRIEVGYGLEGKIPDGVCGRIIRSDLAPLLGKGKYEEGTSRAIDSILQRVGAKYAETEKDFVTELIQNFFLLVVLGFFFYLWGSPFFRKRGRGIYFGNMGGFPTGGRGGFGGGGFGGFGGGSGGGGGASGRF